MAGTGLQHPGFVEHVQYKQEGYLDRAFFARNFVKEPDNYVSINAPAGPIFVAVELTAFFSSMKN